MGQDNDQWWLGKATIAFAVVAVVLIVVLVVAT